MIPEKYLTPSEASIKYIGNCIKTYDCISVFLKFILLLFLPIIILCYRKTNIIEFLTLMLIFLCLCLIWVIFTRKRNILRPHYHLHVWLVDLNKYPDKIKHSKYFNRNI
jgi:hypothetical protein